jgi:hypothetical protein
MDRLEHAIKINDVTRVKQLLQEGATVTTNMLLNIAKSGNLRVLTVLLDERENLPFTFDIIRTISLIPQSTTILEKAVASIARGHPTREIVEQYINFLIRLPDLSAFSAFIDALNLNVDDLLIHAQETTPKALTKKQYARSKRGITRMTRLLGRTPDKISVNKDEWILEQNTLCFCWDLDIGEKKDLLIPVTRYGESAGVGYYGSTKYNDPSFTWYYVEPDSDFVLKSRDAFVARNKIQAFLHFYKQKGMKEMFDMAYQSTEDELAYEFRKMGIKYDDTYISKIMSPTEVPLDPTHSVTSFFRDWDTNKVYFEGGGMDLVDETLAQMMDQLGYDVLVLTHQPGNYGRLVSECLDVRRRSVSFANIYEIA